MTPFCAADIGHDEGCVLHAYPDPESPLAQHLASLELVYVPGDETRFPHLSGAPWTIGYGHAGADVHAGLVWTLAQAVATRATDIGRAAALLGQHAPWWLGLEDPRQDVMVNLCFNMGWGDGAHGLSSFKHTLEAIRLGLYSAAAEGLLASKWAGQVHSRAHRLAEQMKTGVRVAP